jgi:aminopeptidase N
MRIAATQTVFRKDYQPPVFAVESVEMGFDLDVQRTRVATRLHLVRQRPGVLVLQGESIELHAVHLDGRTLAAHEYVLTETTLSLADLPERCVLDLEVSSCPADNTTLSGLYVSKGNLFTQCEAEGFRRITYFPDRPDVMSRFTVMLRASRKEFPVLLSNGNLIDSGTRPGGRHYAKWHDPFPKPSYLFALVAGRLAHAERHTQTGSGRTVLLQIYVEPRDLDKVGHALDALEHSLRWDEKRFGLELDLDRFMIVAVEDFTMGAMENKGLNIFNTRYVLASPELATDMDFADIESVVGHEYFHNWTGNRVTCRDWFQLTLKEGLTVFRDQEFSADMSAGYLEDRDHGAAAATARAVQRIAGVRNLRIAQFPEDAGPMAHPIRPDSYQEINNFYTPTIYEKGAEVVRMQQTLLGREGFRAGIDEYFRRFDGQAVTCDDFVDAIESVYVARHPGRDLKQFRLWYSQAGTPRVTASGSYDPTLCCYTLTLRQASPKVGVERQSDHKKKPFLIPFEVGLLGPDGEDLPLRLKDDEAQGKEVSPVYSRVLEFSKAEESFVFVDVKAPPVPSLLRNFSAPVIVQYPYSEEELAHLSAHDSDAFNRWEASQRLATLELARLARGFEADQPYSVSPRLTEVYRAILAHTELDPALKELALTLPGEHLIGEELPIYDPQAVHEARQLVRLHMAQKLRGAWHATYLQFRNQGPYRPEPRAAGQRALKNLALSYLASLDDAETHTLAWSQFESADNMTDRFAALACMVNNPHPRREEALAQFYKRYANEPLVVDKWLRVQAAARRVGRPGLEVVQELMQHRAFSLRNPNKVYSLLMTFFSSNPAEFHRPDGAGYAFWAEQVLAVDALNPQVASRLARTLDRWRKLTPTLQRAAEGALTEVQRSGQLSKDVSEIIGKTLGS